MGWRISAIVCLAVAALTGCSRDFGEPPDPALVTGTVVLDVLPPQPAADAKMRLVECGLSARTGPEGAVAIPGVPDGEFTLRIDASMDIGGEGTAFVHEEGPVIVQGPGTVPLGDIEVSRAGFVTGTVSVQGGGSALNTVVFVVEGDGLAHASATGSFTLTGVPAGSRVIGAARPGYLAADRTVDVEAGGIASVELSLEPIPPGATGGVSGSVVLGNPGPRAGVVVVLTERFTRTGYTGRTEDDGTFVFSGVPVGYYELTAHHDGYRQVGLPNLLVRADETLSLPALVLPPEGGGSTQNPGDDDPNGKLDDDGDGVPDTSDNCPVVPNVNQRDSDGDGVGDACEVGGDPFDPDGDGVSEIEDNCPGTFNPGQIDEDEDDIGDACDPLVFNPDTDGDGIPDRRDNCPEVENPGQQNHDDDPLGDACDPDDDNDGLLDGPDLCPFIPDPANDAGLCDWQLVYAAQQEAGDIELHHHRMTPTGPTDSQLTSLGGESWGATVPSTPGTTWIYFHHRPRGSPRFRICRIDLDQALVQPVEQADCYDWGADAMNPTVCAGSVIYESFEGDRWNIHAVRLTELAAGGVPVTFMGQNLPPRPVYSFSYPACEDDPGEASLAYCVDFLNPELFPGSIAYDWELWEGSFEYRNGPLVTAISQRSPLPGSHERRPSPLQESGDLIFEREAGGRTDIFLATWDQQGAVLLLAVLADGAQNRDPAYHTPAGLLAYQSDLSGSFDVYVRSPFGGLVRITSGDGWEGSPAWVR